MTKHNGNIIMNKTSKKAHTIDKGPHPSQKMVRVAAVAFTMIILVTIRNNSRKAVDSWLGFIRVCRVGAFFTLFSHYAFIKVPYV